MRSQAREMFCGAARRLKLKYHRHEVGGVQFALRAQLRARTPALPGDHRLYVGGVSASAYKADHQELTRLRMKIESYHSRSVRKRVKVFLVLRLGRSLCTTDMKSVVYCSRWTLSFGRDVRGPQ